MNPANGVAIQPDGKILVAGYVIGPDSTQDFAVIRLNSNGTTDTGFGNNGIVGIPFDNFANEFAVAVAVQSDGKIVLAGSVQFGSPAWDFGVVRLDSSGALDPTFSGGKVKINVAGDDFVRDMTLQSDDKVVITGTTRPTPNNDVALARLTTAGTLDTTLNGTGKVFVGIGSGNNDEGNSVTVQPDGKIIVAGATRGQFSGTFLVIRFTTSGIPDNTFGFFGILQTAVGTEYDAANSVAVHTDGKIVAAGTSNSGSGDAAAFVRYNANGTLDTTFDGDGKLALDIRANIADVISSVLIQSDGKIVGVGTSLVRLLVNGSLDPSFGTDGKVLRNSTPVGISITRAVLQPDGKVVTVGGGSTSSTTSFTVTRFLTVAANKAPVDFEGDGKTDVSIWRSGPGEWWYSRSSDSQVVAGQFGATTDRIVPGDYTGDGKTDIAVWRPSEGNWYILRSEDNSYFAFPFGTNGDVPAPADYDNDGKTDAAVFRPSTTTWFISNSGGSGTSFVNFGLSTDKLVPADYDGDGRADIAIFRPSDGTWWELRSSNLQPRAVQFGLSTDRPVQGDFTGDGKADIAIWRPSTGEWFVLRSEDNSFFSFPWGSSGDIPAPGDYDGDGRLDAAIFRPSNTTWFVSRSTARTLIQQFGVTSDLPVPSAYVP
ncbi:MAG: FG-GAP-like repeat-containing protein [Pyrinomonadaceae bacterium]